MRLSFTPKNIRRTFGLLLVAAIVAWIFIWLGGYTTRVLAVVQRPLVQAGSWVAESAEGLRSRSALIGENEELQEKVAAFSVYQAELESLRDENDSLKLQLGYIMEADYNTVTAHVTARSISPNAATLAIDRGEKDGLSVGDAVIVDEGVVIGKVASITAKTATVRLLSDRASKIASSILDSDRTLGMIEGSAGFLLYFRYIPQNAPIALNQVVISSGLEENVPQGLLIGLINSISSNDTDPFQEAVIEPIVDYRRFTMVSVITGVEEI